MGGEYIPNSQLLSLEGKTAIVTGGAMGIGEGIVKRLFEAKVNVVVADLRSDLARQSFQRLGFGKEEAEEHFIRVDVSYSQSVDSGFERAVERFGGVDILVNNAVIYTTK